MIKTVCLCFVITAVIFACNPSTNTQQQTNTEGNNFMQGTWQLISGTTIEKNDTTVTEYSKDKSFIKIINDSHFAFLGHDLHKGKDSAAAFFSSGGGKYELHDSSYTEHLEYCNDRQWEGNDFRFTVSFQHDTLIQKGIEKIDSIQVNRINIEKYVRLK